MPDMDIIRQMAHDIGTDTTVRLMGVFKEDAEQRIAVVSDFVANGGDVSTLRMQAHSLKGLCRTYGAQAAGDAAMELQDACDGDDETLIRAKAEAALAIIPDDITAAIQAAESLQD